ncbi:kinase-like protein [Whalleya microplaca]|nr:kinase-like protein [Whalleya microplaca]
MATSNSVGPPFHDIQTFADTTGATEEYKEGPPEVIFSTFWKYYDSGEAYFGQVFKRVPDVTVEEIRGSLQRIPDEDIYPEIPVGADLRIATMIDNPKDKVYIKRPSLQTHEDPENDLKWVRDIFLEEAQVLNQVSKTNHKNIIKYHGCLVKDGRLIGIVLERYERNLYEHFCHGRDKTVTLDVPRFMAELESAVYHLHSEKFAHNDLKPSNIMLDEDNMPVLVDFGSCRPFGGRLLQGGTPGWSDPSKLINRSDKEHDIYSLERIREWLADPNRKLKH